MKANRTTTARAGLVLLLACAAFVIGGTSNAEAAFVAAICNDAACTGGGDLVVTDGGVGDIAGTNGTIAMSFATGGFDFTLNTSNSKPVIGSVSAPELNLDYNATSPGAAEAWLFASDTDFAGSGFLTLIANATKGDTQDASAFGGNSNTELDFSNLIAGPAAYTAGVGGDAVATGGPLAAPPAYSLTLGVHLVRLGAGASTGDASLAVPEPASVALFGLGLLGVGLVARRRKQLV